MSFEGLIYLKLGWDMGFGIVCEESTEEQWRDVLDLFYSLIEESD